MVNEWQMFAQHFPILIYYFNVSSEKISFNLLSEYIIPNSKLIYSQFVIFDHFV